MRALLRGSSRRMSRFPMHRALYFSLLLVAAAGCASLRPTLPAPDAGLQRELVKQQSERCGLSHCTASFDVGGTRIQLQHQARTMSPEEATGRPRESIARRAAGAIGGSVRRGLGGTTSSLTVGRGTRTASISGVSFTLRCNVVWIDEATQYREDGEDVTEVARLSQGLDCTSASVADTTRVEWRIRAGLATDAESLRPVFDLVNFPADFDGAPVVVDRAESGVAVPYSVAVRELTITGLIAIPATQWTFRRRDGTLIGAVLRPRLAMDPADAAPGVMTAVDLAPAADEGERAFIRMLGAVLGETFRSTR